MCLPRLKDICEGHPTCRFHLHCCNILGCGRCRGTVQGLLSIVAWRGRGVYGLRYTVIRNGTTSNRCNSKSENVTHVWLRLASLSHEDVREAFGSRSNTSPSSKLQRVGQTFCTTGHKSSPTRSRRLPPCLFNVPVQISAVFTAGHCSRLQ